MKGGKKTLFVLGVLLLISIIMLLVQNIEIKTTGFATTEGTTISNVTISKFLSIAMSDNLSAGIFFGSVSSLPAVNVNASGNNNSIGNSTFFLNVSTDSNTPVDFCIKANSNLYDPTGGNTLGVGNESYSNSTMVNISEMPSAAQEVKFTTGYVAAGQNVSVGNVTYYRFYLDVPVGTPSGTYNNTINFKGIQAGTAC